MDFLKDQENFKRLLKKASYSFEVESVYPTLTYPAHTSITTGNYPLKHGIVNNTLFQAAMIALIGTGMEKILKVKAFKT